MDIKANLTVAEGDAEKIAAKLRADALTAEADAKATQSWLKANWHYAVAIAVGFMVLGVAMGIRVGSHLAH